MPGDTVTLSLSSASGNYATFSLTAVPSESDLDTGFLLDATGATIDYFVPDVAGAYSFTGFDYRKVIGTQSYEGDPHSGARTVLLGSQTGTVYVGTTLDLPIVTTRGHGGTVRLTILNNTIRAAEFSSTIDEVGRVASLTSTVLTKLAALVGVAVSSADDTLATGANDLRSEFEAHRVNSGGSYHDATDSANVVTHYPAQSDSEAVLLINELADRLRDHKVATTTGTRWHKDVDDTADGFTVAKATTGAEAIVLSADLRYRNYARHIARTTVAGNEIHNPADSTNTLHTIKPLPDLIIAYLDAIVALSPAAVTGENTGAIHAALIFGLKRSR